MLFRSDGDRHRRVVEEEGEEAVLGRGHAREPHLAGGWSADPGDFSRGIWGLDWIVIWGFPTGGGCDPAAEWGWYWTEWEEATYL